MANWTIKVSDDVPKDTLLVTITHRDKPLVKMPVDETLGRALTEAATRAADLRNAGAGWLIPSTSDLKALFKTKPKIGDEMPDGSIYFGERPLTGKPIYTTREDYAEYLALYKKSEEYTAAGGRAAHFYDQTRAADIYTTNEDFARFNALSDRADEYTITLRFGPLPPTAPKPGDKMPDGSICAGRSPENGKMMYTMPVDEPLTVTFKQASEQAAVHNMTDTFGHHDWRVPMKSELNVMFNNRAVIGGFDESGSNPSGWYLSSPSPDDRPLKSDGIRVPWVQRFSDGLQDFYFEPGAKPAALRCIRYG